MSTTIVLTILLFSIWFVPFRLKRLLDLKKSWPGFMAAAALVVGYLALIASGAYTADNFLAASLYNVSGLLFAVFGFFFAYLLLTFAISHRLRKISGRKIATLGILISAGLVALGFASAHSFKVTEHEIKVKGLSRPVSVMHISDLHLGAQRGRPYLEKILAAIESRGPDLVLYNGDMVDSNIALKPEIFALFKTVRAKQYFITGNHDFYVDADRALGLMADSGLVILRNEMVETHGLQLVGLEYMRADRETYDPHRVNDLTIEEELPKIALDPDKPVILAHHSPVGLKHMAKAPVDVLFSGHTHGGQIFPITLLAALRFPLKPGLHKVEETWVLVSQGAGTFGPWMRLGTSNEIQFVTLAPY